MEKILLSSELQWHGEKFKPVELREEPDEKPNAADLHGEPHSSPVRLPAEVKKILERYPVIDTTNRLPTMPCVSPAGRGMGAIPQVSKFSNLSWALNSDSAASNKETLSKT